jgi:CubicO group peptidase (beta-lactamase class C family)
MRSVSGSPLGRFVLFGVVGCACGSPPSAARPEAPSNPAPAGIQPAKPGADPFEEPDGLAPPSWLVLGPFENAAPKQGKLRQGMAEDLLKSLGGEPNAVLTPQSSVAQAGKTYGVKPATTNKAGIVDLVPLYEGSSDWKVAYAYGEVSVGAPMRALAHFGSDDAAIVWVNGQEVHRAIVDRGVSRDDDRFDVPLVQGKNRILVKVDNAGGGWGFALELYDEPAKKRLETIELRRHLEHVEVRPKTDSFFLESSFPELAFVHPLGAHTVLSEPKVRWFDPHSNEVARPGPDGRYVALVEATTTDGAPYRRMVTFAKLAEKHALSKVSFEPYGLPPDVELGWPSQASRAERDEVSRFMWRSMSIAFESTEEGAIAALAISELDPKKPKAEPRPWYEGALVKDAQHKLTVRLKIEGRAPRPLSSPASLPEPAPVLHPGSEAQAGMKPGTVNQLRALFRDWGKADANGFVVLVARKGVVFMHEAFNGFEKGTLFHPASIAKTITGLTFARAVDQKLVGFDDPLAKVFPAYAGEKTKDITFRHCFYHLTGLKGHFSHGGLFNPFLENDLLIQDLRFDEPGTHYQYNGNSMNLAGAALSLITGRTMMSLYHEHLEAPFGEPVMQLDGGSGTRFSAMYLAKVGQMLLQDGAYGAHRFYSPGFIRELFPKQAAKYAPRLDDKKLENGIGLIWTTDPDGPRENGVLGPNVVGHGAATGVFFRVAFDHELVIVVGRNEHGGFGANELWGDKLAAKVAENIVREKRP